MALSVVEAGRAAEESVVSRTCPACGSAHRTILPYGRDGWRTAQCSGCRFIYMPEVPDYSAVATTFEWSASFAVETERRKRTSPLLSRLDQMTRVRTRFLGRRNPMQDVRRYIGAGRVVDVGCGNGSYLAATGGGYSLYGIDISPTLTAQADALFRQHGGYAVCAPSIIGLTRFDSSFFDAAILRSYLEHEPDPAGVLDGLARTLRPGGVAVVKVPNFASLNRLVRGEKWCGFRFPDHVNYFTPASLRSLAEARGYRVTMRFRDRLPTDDNFWAVLQRPA